MKVCKSYFVIEGGKMRVRPAVILMNGSFYSLCFYFSLCKTENVVFALWSSWTVWELK